MCERVETIFYTLPLNVLVVVRISLSTHMFLQNILFERARIRQNNFFIFCLRYELNLQVEEIIRTKNKGKTLLNTIYTRVR